MKSIITDEEAFHNEYRVFINAVEILSQPAGKQSEIMGGYNVACELKDDVAAGKYLLKNTASTFNENQRLIVEQLINELNKIPKEVVVFTDIKEESLKAMEHPCWEPLRKHAAIVIRALETATINNEKYFK